MTSKEVTGSNVSCLHLQPAALRLQQEAVQDVVFTVLVTFKEITLKHFLFTSSAGCIQQLSRCPENQSVPLGTTASFHCEVQPSLSQLYEVDWIVQLKDGSIHHQHNLLSLQEMGFAPDDGELIGSNLTLRVLGTEKTSNSRITCRVYEHESGQVYFAEVANLIVTGKKELIGNYHAETLTISNFHQHYYLFFA